MITRLRLAHTPEALQEIYSKPHDHRRFGRGHGERVDKMIEMMAGTKWTSAADLSCGNGAVLNSVDAPLKYYGDFAPGYDITGPIENTVLQVPPVELFIMGETLEHLDDPLLVLQRVAQRTDWLLLSTPIENWNDSNAEHYWSWDQQGVEDLISKSTEEDVLISDFSKVDTRVYGEPYCYGVWLVRM